MVLIGRLTDTALVKKLKDEREVVNFSIAINYYYKPKGSPGVTLTTYYQCSYWISTKVAPLLTKGTLVEVQGRISVRPYTSYDGEAKASLNCHVNSITVHQRPYAPQEQMSDAKEEVADDLPF